jgi:outer membrane protein OmpA-like peptidoglycan-associated protein
MARELRNVTAQFRSRFRAGRSCLLALLFLGACAGQNSVFVLLPDENGKVGAIEVATEAGTQRIDTANEATTVSAKDRPPEKPTALEQAEIDKVWGAAIRTAPLAPKTFILYFRTGTDRLTDESQKQFPKIFAELYAYPAAELSIVGHTDTVGSKADNTALALKRAESTRQRLVEAGLKHDRIEVLSHGESNPLISTGDNVDEPRNRRVEVTIR